MAALSIDLRRRILGAYDNGEGTRQQIASRFNVSLGMVKKLIQQRKQTGDIAPRYNRCGRKPIILPTYGDKIRALVEEKPDITLAEIRAELGIKCSLNAIHSALAKLALTYKKRRSALPSKTEKT